MGSDLINVLVVDDDDVDVAMIERAFTKLKIANPITLAGDGIEALERLRGKNGTPPLERPYVVLLDLNMPRMGGHEFLCAVREDKELRDSVVFVLTTSAQERDIVDAYQQNVAGYIVKADAGNGFLDVMRTLNDYWMQVVLPS